MMSNFTLTNCIKKPRMKRYAKFVILEFSVKQHNQRVRTVILTSVVCVNGLSLTLRVSVNSIMKFIYTPCKRNSIMFIYIHVSVVEMQNTKSVTVKLCKFISCYVKQCKKCDFYSRRGDFIMFWKISQLNGPLQKKTIKIYTHD